jgi:hypothetical protein
MFAAFLMALVAAAGPLAGPPATREVLGTVTDGAHRPLPGVVVVAVDAASDVVAALATTDEQGRVQLRLPDRPHLFGVMSSRYGVERLVTRGATDFRLVLRPLAPPAGAAPREGAGVPAIRARGAAVIQGRVVDESGQGLAGVRVDGARATDVRWSDQGMQASGVVVSSALSGRDGTFTLVIPGGDTQLQARAPGLVLARSALQPPRIPGGADRHVLIMAVDAAAQSIVVSQGHLLRVRLADSIDPEYTPPAAVRAWLQVAHGICPASGPLTEAQKQTLKKYWYLEVLRNEPPNPASISAGSCVPPWAYGGVSLAARAGFGAVQGLEVVDPLP